MLLSTTAAVRRAMADASVALTANDLPPLAERVISGDSTIDALSQTVEQRALAVMATQQPVARDMREVAIAMRVAIDLERMGDIADLVRRRYPKPVMPSQLVPTIRVMGEVADSIAGKCQQALVTRDIETAASLEHDDDAMDDVHRQLLGALLSKR